MMRDRWTLNCSGNYVQMSLLINEMDRQQIHHKYTDAGWMNKSTNPSLAFSIWSFNIQMKRWLTKKGSMTESESDWD